MLGAFLLFYGGIMMIGICAVVRRDCHTLTARRVLGVMVAMSAALVAGGAFRFAESL